jgi:phospholipase C gamma, putative (fragment)
MLTKNKLYFVEDNKKEDNEDESEEKCSKEQEDPPRSTDELHFSEKWFHGKLPDGRSQATALLQKYSHLGDGTFLVRESDTFIGDYSLSFWRQGQVNHCRIRSKQNKGRTQYYLNDSMLFNSLYSLISYYQSHPLRSSEFSIYLREPVPQPKNHESKEWYYANMNRITAEDVLSHIPQDGTFLVRPSEKEDNCFAISFRAENKIKHCRVNHEERLFSIGSVRFESLVDLIEWYKKHAFYKNVKLKYSVNDEVLRQISKVINKIMC